MIDGVGTTTYTYTAAGNLLTEDNPWASDTVTYAYHEPGTIPGCHPGGNPINLADMVGREGVAISVLRPSGQVQIRAVRYDAVAEGGYLEAGTAVRVMDVKQGSLVVRAQLPSSV
jgi:YD repeat-containing protein